MYIAEKGMYRMNRTAYCATEPNTWKGAVVYDFRLKMKPFSTKLLNCTVVKSSSSYKNSCEVEGYDHLISTFNRRELYTIHVCMDSVVSGGASNLYSNYNNVMFGIGQHQHYLEPRWKVSNSLWCFPSRFKRQQKMNF